jgi:hypothetical protein
MDDRMTKFTKTTPNPVIGHDHIVFLDNDNQIALTSVDDGHSHSVMWMSPSLDPTTGQPVGEGYWYVDLAVDKDGQAHGHDLLQEYPKVFEPQDRDEDDPLFDDDTSKVAEVVNIYRDLMAQTEESYEEFDKAEEFYCGQQWDEEVKQKLNSTSRAALTINKIETGIDDLCGFQRQNRSDFRYTPLEDGDQRKADILNIVAKDICSFSNFQMVESEVFLDICIGGLGLFHVKVDFSNNIEGDVGITRFPWERARLGPHDELDGSDREVDTKHQWLSLSHAKARFPEYAEEIDTYWDALQEKPNEESFLADIKDPYAHGTQSSVDLSATDLVNVSRREVLLLEMLRKEYFYAPAMVYEPTSGVYDGLGWSKKDVKRAATIPGVITAPRYSPKMRKTVIVGGVLVYDKSPAPVPGDTFNLIPAYGKRRRGRFWGKVRSAMDPQRELNKRTSQTIDIVNRMISDITYYDDSTFPDEHDKNQFIRNSSTPGWTQRLTDVNKRPVRESGTQFPAEVAQLIAMADAQLTAIMNIKAQPVATGTDGAILMQQVRMMLAGNEYLFDNLIKAKKQLAKLLIHYIQKYYTPKRIVRLIRKSAAKQQGSMIGGQPAETYSDEEIQALFETSDLSRYDVDVSESAFSPTMRVATLLVLKELAQQGQPVPFPVIIEYMDIPQEAKDKMLLAYSQQQQAQASAQEATSEMETTKTALAQGIVPPKFRYQMEQQQKEVDQLKAQEQQQQGQFPAPGILNQ